MNRIVRKCIISFLFLICGFSVVFIFNRVSENWKIRMTFEERNSSTDVEQVAELRSEFVEVKLDKSKSHPLEIQTAQTNWEERTVYLGENLLHDSDYLDIGVIFTKVSGNGILKHKYQTLLRSILKNTRSPIHIHLLTDEQSLLAAQHITRMLENQQRIPVKVTPYFIQDIAQRVKDIISVMQTHFSAKPGAYYADALFFISLVFYKVAPPTLDRIIFIDVDCKVATDIRDLFDHFAHFQEDHVIGLVHELTPVYRHVLYTFRSKHNSTLFGEPHGKGFPGFNSGVILMDLKKLRQSREYSSLLSKTVIDVLAAKYSFRGHLGDQDFFTLTAFEYPELYYIVPCGWNRQLCRWWENRGYEDVFQFYFECADKVKIYHANCNSEFPEL